MTLPAHDPGHHGGSTPLKAVLLVEDDSNDAHLAMRELAKIGLLNPVFHVSNVEDLIAYMTGESIYADREKYPLPRVVLLDMHLKASDGLDGAAWLRSKSKFRKIAIIAISGSGPERLQSAVAMGAHALMEKPFRTADFLNVIKKLGVDLSFDA
jgi:CheY-like chemotaxis protein